MPKWCIEAGSKSIRTAHIYNNTTIYGIPVEKLYTHFAIDCWFISFDTHTCALFFVFFSFFFYINRKQSNERCQPYCVYIITMNIKTINCSCIMSARLQNNILNAMRQNAIKMRIIILSVWFKHTHSYHRFLFWRQFITKMPIDERKREAQLRLLFNSIYRYCICWTRFCLQRRLHIAYIELQPIYSLCVDWNGLMKIVFPVCFVS